MKAAVLYEARQPLQIEELEMPQVGDEDILIKVAACGVCHTDLKVVEGRTASRPRPFLDTKLREPSSKRARDAETSRRETG